MVNYLLQRKTLYCLSKLWQLFSLWLDDTRCSKSLDWELLSWTLTFSFWEILAHVCYCLILIKNRLYIHMCLSNFETSTKIFINKAGYRLPFQRQLYIFVFWYWQNSVIAILKNFYWFRTFLTLSCRVNMSLVRPLKLILEGLRLLSTELLT